MARDGIRVLINGVAILIARYTGTRIQAEG
jgi:hypothetical protein